MKNTPRLILLLVRELIIIVLMFIFFLPIFFLPILPIMLLAFPMMVMNEGTDKVHWTQKPYLWYFKNVWLKSMYAIRLF
jgi:hypothetical protein